MFITHLEYKLRKGVEFVLLFCFWSVSLTVRSPKLAPRKELSSDPGVFVPQCHAPTTAS